ATPAAGGGAVVGHVLASEEHVSRRRPVQPAAGVERRRLAGAVRADEPGEPAERRREAEVVHRHQPAEGDGQALELESRAGFPVAHESPPTGTASMAGTGTAAPTFRLRTGLRAPRSPSSWWSRRPTLNSGRSGARRA